MNWLEYHNYLEDQRKAHFPRGDLRPFLVEGDWSDIDAMLRSEEQHSRINVEKAIWDFIWTGNWPTNLSEKEKVFINQRLSFAIDTALRLAVPLPDLVKEVEPPFGATRESILLWLLNTQWDTLGSDFWFGDLKSLYITVHHKRKNA